MPFIYILTNKTNSTLYVGVTNDLKRRIWEHKNNMVEGFSSHYQLHRLVYYEQINKMTDAIMREKQLKCWHREWKERLINKQNPQWLDLYEEVCL